MSSGGLELCTVERGPLDLEALFDAFPDEPAVYWATPEETWLGLGAARSWRIDGSGRFTALRDEAAALPAWARVFTAFAFAPGGGAGALPDGWGLLPRHLLHRRGHRTEIGVASVGADHVHRLAELDAAIARTSSTSARGDLAAAALDLTGDSDRDGFVRRVARARQRIAAGELDKVVLHLQRRVALRATARPPAASSVLQRLATTQPAALRYAFRLDGRVFIGATPERLVERDGDRVRVDVLAGSLPRQAEADPATLLADPKERGEHAITRDAIVEVLRRFCHHVDERGPVAKILPHLYHLHTEMEGTLDAPAHVLDLVEALHPTPAVGGSPRAAAIDFLRAEEPRPRLWYTGPIGWFRPDGDGDFRVALRCALLEPDGATLYAGAGVVADSDPARELVEVSWKQRAMAAALGLSVAG